MTIAQNSIDQVSAEIVAPPIDLNSDEPPLDDLHLQQIILFLECLNWWWRDRNDFYASANTTIYYSEKQLKSRDFRGPDFFVVLGVERKLRKSWVVWGEDGKTPNVIVEILSDSTAEIDRTVKKQIYQDTLKVYDYFWFDPDTLEFAGFYLVNGQYQPISPNQNGWLWSQQLELFLGVRDRKLRFFTSAGELLPTPAEAAIAAQAKVDRLADKLRELNIDPDAL
ncbi:Uma2 family endonuclease [Microcoleus sp. FACHB-1515]|uniref:Uma2 family endonuclease n=1 Tax=Cyanophyceae TaxID=3028117 RepID=UPI001682FC05|nr:Uma2 family endonuclease [Microcoleus sp. FACHB-1515]MBD2090028.1 Uma2 family endonuclease [Microcoleus sp. FACHB-1515]